MLFNETPNPFCDTQQIINNFLAQNPIYNYNLIAYLTIMTISGFMILFEDVLKGFFLKRFNSLNFEHKWIIKSIFDLPRLFIFGLSFALLFQLMMS